MSPAATIPRVTHADLEALRDELREDLAAVAARADQAKAISADTNAKVNELHAALMQPSPGQSRALLDRMAEATINLESGTRVGRILVWLAAVVGAGAVLLKLGAWPNHTP